MGRSESEVVTDEQKKLEAEFAEFIANHRWTFAKTYAAFCPHEYVVKNKLPYSEWKDFEKFVRFIRDFGWDSIYGSGRDVRQYYSMGEYYYWTMGAPVEETTVLNRAKFENFEFEVDNFGDLRCYSKIGRRKRKT